MLRFEHEGKSYRLKFHHDRDYVVRKTIMGEVQFRAARGGLTTAVVEVDENGQWKEAFIGQAFCHPQDNFCKETGRRVALEDLFKENGDILTKDFKSAINTAYWNRK
jgi:hypothetical protein